MSATLCGFNAVLRRELQLIWQQPSDVAQPLTYFALVCALAPLAVDPGPALLRGMAPAVIWLAVLVAMLGSAERVLREDADDGVLEQWLLSPQPLWLLMAAKGLGHWLTAGLLFAVATPVAGLMFGLPGAALLPATAAVALGTLSLAMLGLVGGALTVGHPRGGLLLLLVVLPLLVPVLIFGAVTIRAAADGLSPAGPLYLLAAQAVLHCTLSPPAAAIALRISHD